MWNYWDKTFWATKRLLKEPWQIEGRSLLLDAIEYVHKNYDTALRTPDGDAYDVLMDALGKVTFHGKSPEQILSFCCYCSGTKPRSCAYVEWD
jgi:hypothetical protein